MTYHIASPKLIQGIPLRQPVAGQAALAFPSPQPEWLAALAHQLREAWLPPQDRPTPELLHLLDAVNARWADPGSPERCEADPLLAAVTGYPPAVIAPALDHLFAGLQARQLEALLAEELGDPRALDTWIERPALGTRSRAFGPRLTLVVASGNVPMAAIPSIVDALLLKSPVLVKLSSDEPVLAGLYLRSLAAADEALGRACAAVWWPGGDEAIESAVLPHVDAVIAFGGEAALRSLARHLEPSARFQPHGHRVGFGVIGRERLTREELSALAGAAARDVAEFDQQGCVAPQRLFVERGGAVDPRELAAALAEALAVKAGEWPRIPPPPAASAAIHQLRAAAEIRATLQSETAVFAGPAGTDWTVILDPEPGFGPGCLYRTVIVHPVDDLAAVPEIVSSLASYLQTAALAVSPNCLPELADRLARAGVTRLCPLGRTQRPAPGWHPDGRPRLAELVRWVDIEEGLGVRRSGLS
jgi:hypothetical protein